MKFILGIDEVGRGPLAGPVTVGVVCCEARVYAQLKKSKLLPPLGKDSKKLSTEEREKYSQVLHKFSRENKLFFSVQHISNKIIDTKGLTFAINTAIGRGISTLKINPKETQVLLDGGLRAPKEFLKQKTIVKGDEKEKIIAWASILAKVSRDELMRKMSKMFPQYGFELHKGYGTAAHRLLIEKNGLSPAHRATFCRNIDFIF